MKESVEFGHRKFLRHFGFLEHFSEKSDRVRKFSSSVGEELQVKLIKNIRLFL